MNFVFVVYNLVKLGAWADSRNKIEILFTYIHVPESRIVRSNTKAVESSAATV